MAAKRLLPLCLSLIGLLVFLGLASCQQPPAEGDGSQVKKTELVHGKKVEVVGETLQQTPEKDRAAVNQGAEDIKSTTKAVTFTPGEQQSGK